MRSSEVKTWDIMEMFLKSTDKFRGAKLRICSVGGTGRGKERGGEILTFHCLVRYGFKERVEDENDSQSVGLIIFQSFILPHMEGLRGREACLIV